jgi:CPA2 family monovalent cation:H+ antiporter-2
MHETLLLGEFTLLVAVAIVAALLLHRLKLPVIAGLLTAGALAGPHGFRLVRNTADIEGLAEIGVVLLLFTIGLEFTPSRLQRVGRLVSIGGLLQVGLTIGAVAAVATLAGIGLQRGLVFGFVLALSSTAIVLRLLAERGELDAPHGQMILGVLIFQDLAVVPMMLAIPLLAGQTEGGLGLALATVAFKAVALLGSAWLLSRHFLPRLFAWVDATRSRELFLLTVLAVCLGTAFLSYQAGLSLALGSFVAGVMLAESNFAQRALGDLLPLRDILTSLFFISIGMLFDARAVLAAPLLVAGLLLAIILGKGFIATLAALVLKFPARVAWLTGIGLAQFGEFGYVLLRSAHTADLVSPREESTILAAGVISMFLTPLLIALAPRLRVGERLLRPLERLIGVEAIDEPQTDTSRHDHIVIVGFGPAGRLLGDILKRYGVQYLALDLNARTVQDWRDQGEPIYYGDATSPEALHHARLEEARLVVIMVNDPQAAERAVAAARAYSKTLPILVRTRFIGEQERLVRLGADDVVVEEMEAGKSMVTATLGKLGIDRRRPQTEAQERRDDIHGGAARNKD